MESEGYGGHERVGGFRQAMKDSQGKGGASQEASGVQLGAHMGWATQAQNMGVWLPGRVHVVVMALVGAKKMQHQPGWQVGWALR